MAPARRTYICAGCAGLCIIAFLVWVGSRCPGGVVASIKVQAENGRLLVSFTNHSSRVLAYHGNAVGPEMVVERQIGEGWVIEEDLSTGKTSGIGFIKAHERVKCTIRPIPDKGLYRVNSFVTVRPAWCWATDQLASVPFVGTALEWIESELSESNRRWVQSDVFVVDQAALQGEQNSTNANHQQDD